MGPPSVNDPTYLFRRNLLPDGVYAVRVFTVKTPDLSVWQQPPCKEPSGPHRRDIVLGHVYKRLAIVLDLPVNAARIAGTGEIGRVVEPIGGARIWHVEPATAESAVDLSSIQIKRLKRGKARNKRSATGG
jgi:hypothetical protein